MDVEEIRQLDNEACEAFLRGDIAALKRLFADDFVVTNPYNQVLDKQQVLEALESGRIKHSDYERQIEVLHIYTDIAVVMGRERVVEDRQTKNRRYTEIWLRRAGGWQIVARHASQVAA